MLTFVKLGGSLITDKRGVEVFHAERTAALARAIQQARQARPDLQLVIGHGSGSFGHVAAHRHQTAAGVRTAAEWEGFAEVARAAGRLNRLVTDALAGAGIPVWNLQPSASAECADGALQRLEVRPLQVALEHGLVPLVYGDVALDTVRGGTIVSTEALFFFLAPVLRPERVVLLGEVAGVLDPAGRVIPRITPLDLPEIEVALGGSHGVDVTGGMASKVRDMVALVTAIPGLTVQIVSGLDADLVRQVLVTPDSAAGTVICGG
ncbi:MAG: uridylate kinase [Anaerolineae bacterium]|nr:uridylate kinase [Anaerolineae bacterium]